MEKLALPGMAALGRQDGHRPSFPRAGNDLENRGACEERVVLAATKHWGVLGFTGRPWDVLGFAGMQWDILGCTGIYWSALVLTGIY